MNESEFGAPHDWCDRQCARCNLRATCTLAGRPEQAPPIVVDRARLRGAAVAHATATLSLLEPAVAKGRLERALASAIVADAFAVVARIGALLGARGDAAVGQLLVLEVLLTRVDTAVLALEAFLSADGLSEQRRCRWELGRKLAPRLAAIGAEHRAALAALVLRGEAPSPFCIASDV